MTDRAQTIQDYLLGITLLLITLTATFGYFPGIFQPFEDPISNEEETMAENMGDELVSLNQTVGSQRTVNYTAFEQFLNNKYRSLEALAGVPEWKNTNVTVVYLDGDTLKEVDSFGDRRQDSPEATILRFIQAQDPNHDCSNGCQVIIRVW